MNKSNKSKIMFLAYCVCLIPLVFAINNAWVIFMSGTARESNPVIEISDEVIPLSAMSIGENSTDEPLLEYDVIAIIYSEKIGLYSSVLSEWSPQLLDISVNKFSGPEPNEEGNLVLLGRNYADNGYFGSIHLLVIGDLISLTDQTGRTLLYSVYEISIIKPEALEKLSTDYETTLTMVTSDKDQLYWLVVKSKAIAKP